jgi:2,3-bisphosphoglycerate-dependent phosphoglycerate mutase
VSEPGAFTQLALVRHGETEWNSAGIVQGTLDSPLSARGQAQAQALVRAFADEPIDRIYSSDLGRTQATIAPLAAARGLKVHLDPRLRERAYGVLEGHTWASVEANFAAAYARLSARDIHFAPPEGESAVAFHERVMAAMRDIVIEAAGQRVLVVSHGGSIGTVYRFVREMPLEAKRDYALFNASINRFRVVEERWHLDVWGDTSHLEGDAAPESN